MDDTLLDLFQEVCIFVISDNESISLRLFDPIHCLGLWIDVESPSQALGDEDSVLGGELVCWQSVDLPLTSLGSAGHELREVETFGVWNLL